VLEVTITLPDGYLQFLKERGINFEAKNHADFITGLLHTIYGNPKKPDSRIEWFVDAVQKVEKHSSNPEEAVLYCLSLERQCETLEELKQKMYRIFSVLKPPEPEKYGYCTGCDKPMSEYDWTQGEHGLCPDCLDAAITAIRLGV